MFYGERIGGRGAAFANAAQWTVRLGRLGRDTFGFMQKGRLKFLYPRAAEINGYDNDLLGANWRPVIGVLALASEQAHRDWRLKLPEDSAKLDHEFVVRLRVLASRI